MTSFDADILSELRGVREVAIRTEKHPKNAVVIWVVVADDQLLVRSVRGTKGRWYRDLAAGGSATLEFAGRRCRRSPRGTPAPSTVPAGNTSESIARAPMRRRW